MDLQQVIAVHAHRPRRVELREDLPVGTVQRERGVRSVVGRRGVAAALLAHALGDEPDTGALHGGDRAEGVVEQVAPVGEHVEHDSAAIFLAVIPGWALWGRSRVVALEHPVPEFAAHAQDAAEEPVFHQSLELTDAGEEQLVLHDAVLHAAPAGRPCELERLGHGRGDRLLAVDVLAGRDGATHVADAEARHRGVEVDLVRRVREAGVQVGRDARQAVRGGDLP